MFRTAFCIGIFNSKNLPIFLLRRFIPFFHYTTIHPGSQRFPADGNHPRLCGEKRFAPASSSLVRGSPPPMRGKVVRVQRCQQVIGITPAYAGKSSMPSPLLMDIKDHPRLCGEKAPIPDSGTSLSGSPPPMRGKVSKCPPVNFFHRITPAYAGKSRPLPPPVPTDRDHPRLCGEKAVVYRFMYFRIGSPPPMRGKVNRTSEKPVPARITPAYAGKRGSLRIE